MRGFKAELSNGDVFTEDNIKAKLARQCNELEWNHLPPWAILKRFAKIHNLKIVSLELQFDHQSVFLPRNAKAYFYSKKVEAFLGPTASQLQYYGIGATEHKDDEVEITWYDGTDSKIEKRKIDPSQESYFINR